jgi:hypothetical protein
LLKKYPDTKFVRFADDTLSADKRWFREFANRYKSQIKLPYSTNVHPHNIDQEIARLYRESGCVSVEMGIENGNTRIRREFMKRPFSNEEVVRAFTIMRGEKINTHAFNIFGFPHETISTILDTVKANAQAKPKTYIKAYFQPFFGTEAFAMCKEMGIAINDLKSSFFEEPAIELPSASRAQIMFGFKYFGALVRLYRLFYYFSGNKDSMMIRIADKIFTFRWFPYGFFNRIYLDRMDVKKRFPHIAAYLTRIKRFISCPEY